VAASDWSRRIQAITAASTGSSVATTATRGAGRWRSALTISRNGTSVPITATPRASMRFRAEPSSSHGKVQTGATRIQNSVAKPKPHERNCDSRAAEMPSSSR